MSDLRHSYTWNGSRYPVLIDPKSLAASLAGIDGNLEAVQGEESTLAFSTENDIWFYHFTSVLEAAMFLLHWREIRTAYRQQQPQVNRDDRLYVEVAHRPPPYAGQSMMPGSK